MASGRTFSWHASDGRVLALDRALGYWVLEGVTGLGRPVYQNDNEANALEDGTTPRGSRAASRQVFLPMEAYGFDRAQLIQRMQQFVEMTNPKYGPGNLYIVDGGRTYRLQCMYREGMEGGEGPSATGESGEGNERHSQRTGPVFEAIDPFFESPELALEEWGYGGDVSFFSSPFFPVKLNPSQVLSSIGQPARFNRLTNPSFELNVTSWEASVFGNPATTITREVVWGTAPAGTAPDSWAGQVIWPNTATETGPSIVGAGLTVGEVYTAHGWIYVPSSTPFIPRLDVFFNAGNVLVTERDRWVWNKIQFTALGTSERVIITADGGSPAGGLVALDKWAITEGTVNSPEEYIDGDQLYCHWSGTPHASTSFQDPIYKPAVINSSGTVEAYPVVKIVGPGSTFISENTRTGRRLTLSLGAPLASGEVVTMDHRAKTITRADGSSLYRYLTEDDFWPLLPGENMVRFALSGAAAGSRVVVTHYPRYESIVG